MFLTKKNIICKESNLKVPFEKVDDDLLMISISNETPNQGILSYWRLTKVVGIPPLEIGIDCNKGNVASITFFVDTPYIKKSKNINTISEWGNLLVDTNIFTRVNDYVDVDQAYEVNISEDKLICAFMKESEFKKSYRNDRLEIFSDYQNHIIGFSICDLTVEEKKMMKSL